MDLFTSVTLAIVVTLFSGGIFIMDRRTSDRILVYEANIKAQELSTVTTEKVTEAYNQIASDLQHKERLTDCQEVKKAGYPRSGVYTIFVANYGPVRVRCDMETDGGGWTVFQTRRDGALDFNKNWMEYKIGFGKPEGEFWLGNDALHRLTSQSVYELRVDVTDSGNSSGFAVYKYFHIGSSETNYHLSVADYSGNIDDALSDQTGRQFSTYDADHDNNNRNCAYHFNGGWWYDDCRTGLVNNLNGCFTTVSQYTPGVFWQGLEYYYSIKHTQMMIRRI